MKDNLVKINLSEIDSFKEHPFSVNKDDSLMELVHSIKENGLLNPMIVRKKDNGRYEMISGHRRKAALEILGIDESEVVLKELNDDEMIEYYTNLVKQYGGKLTAKWVYGMVVYNGKETKEYTWSKKHFYFIDKPSEKRNPGYPLDSISIMPECNKYFVELTDEDKKQNKENYNDDDVIEFIVNSL
mgnify:CR=1 FL=1